MVIFHCYVSSPEGKLGHLVFFSLRKYHRTKILEIPLSESVGGHLDDPSHILAFTAYYRRTRRMVIPVALRRNLVMPVAFLLTCFACGFPWEKIIGSKRDLSIICSKGFWWSTNIGIVLVHDGWIMVGWWLVQGLCYPIYWGWSPAMNWISFTTNQIAWIDGGLWMLLIWISCERDGTLQQINIDKWW